MQKRKTPACNENCTRPRNHQLGVVPSRSSPQFHVCPVSNCDILQTSESLQNKETQKNDPIGMENDKKEQWTFWNWIQWKNKTPDILYPSCLLHRDKSIQAQGLAMNQKQKSLHFLPLACKILFFPLTNSETTPIQIITKLSQLGKLFPSSMLRSWTTVA